MFNRVMGSIITQKSIPQGAATTVFACVAPGVGTDGVSGVVLLLKLLLLFLLLFEFMRSVLQSGVDAFCYCVGVTEEFLM